MKQISDLVDDASRGHAAAMSELLPIVYQELRRVAAGYLRRERPGQTLQATALVHEAYVRLVGDENGQQFEHRGHFFAAAAMAMRRILVEQVRRKQRLKWGGERHRVPQGLENRRVAEGAAPAGKAVDRSFAGSGELKAAHHQQQKRRQD